MIDSARSTALERVIYGLYEPHRSLAVFEETDAKAKAAEYQAVYDCATYGDVTALLPTLKHIDLPEDPDEIAEEDPDSPFDARETGAAQEGDWPPMPTANVLILLRADSTIWADLVASGGVKVVNTTLNGDYAEISPEHETELIATLARHGVSAVRNDELIGRLGGG